MPRKTKLSTKQRKALSLLKKDIAPVLRKDLKELGASKLEKRANLYIANEYRRDIANDIRFKKSPGRQVKRLKKIRYTKPIQEGRGRPARTVSSPSVPSRAPQSRKLGPGFETRVAKNGVIYYYIDGKRVSEEVYRTLAQGAEIPITEEPEQLGGIGVL